MVKKNDYIWLVRIRKSNRKRAANVFLKELNNSKVIGVFDKIEKNDFFSKLFKCKQNNSLNSFLNNRFDFIYIATESAIITII